jgi:hypothetical protein
MGAGPGAAPWWDCARPSRSVQPYYYGSLEEARAVALARAAADGQPRWVATDSSETCYAVVTRFLHRTMYRTWTLIERVDPPEESS